MIIGIPEHIGGDYYMERLLDACSGVVPDDCTYFPFVPYSAIVLMATFDKYHGRDETSGIIIHLLAENLVDYIDQYITYDEVEVFREERWEYDQSVRYSIETDILVESSRDDEVRSIDVRMPKTFLTRAEVVKYSYDLVESVMEALEEVPIYIEDGFVMLVKHLRSYIYRNLDRDICLDDLVEVHHDSSAISIIEKMM